MNLGRKKAVTSNLIVSVIFQFVVIINGFIIPQLFLTSYGAEVHGLTSVIKSLMSFVLLLSAGLNSASTVSLYKPLAEKNYLEINSTLNAINKQYRITGTLYFIVILILAILSPTFINALSSNYIALMMIIMGLQTVLDCLLLSSLRILVQADQKLFVYNFLNTISMILRSVIQIVLMARGASALIVQALPAIMVFFTYALLTRYVNKNYPALDKNVTPNDGALSQRWSALTHQVAGLVLNNTDIIILTVMSGDMVIASIYSVYELVFNHLYNFMTSIFSQSSVASFGNLLLTNSRDKLVIVYNLYEFGYYLIVSIIYSITACMILPFVELYSDGVSNVNYTDPILALLFIIYSLANNLRVPGNTMINAAGKFKETQYRAILEATINLVFTLVLFPRFEIYALVMGTIAAFAYRTTDIIIYSNKHILFKSPRTTFIRGIRVIATVVINILIFTLVLKVSINSWIDWILSASTIGIISIFTTLIISLIFERSTIKEVIGQITHRS